MAPPSDSCLNCSLKAPLLQAMNINIYGIWEFTCHLEQFILGSTNKHRRNGIARLHAYLFVVCFFIIHKHSPQKSSLNRQPATASSAKVNPLPGLSLSGRNRPRERTFYFPVGTVLAKGPSPFRQEKRKRGSIHPFWKAFEPTEEEQSRMAAEQGVEGPKFLRA